MAAHRILNPAHSVFLAFFIYAFSLGMLFPRLGDIQLSLGIVMYWFIYVRLANRTNSHCYWLIKCSTDSLCNK